MPAPPPAAAAAPAAVLRVVGGDVAFPLVPPDGTFTAQSAGVSLHVRVYEPAVARGRTLLLLHGAFEHGGRYGHAAAYFAARGWRVLVPDLRGHGESGGEPMHARRFDEYAADVRAILAESACDPARTAAIGNSMGGLVLARLAQGAGETGHAAPPLAAAALCSPLLRIVTPVPLLTRAAGRAVTLVRPTTRFAVPPDPDSPAKSDAAADPLRHDSVTAAWFFAVRRGVRDAWRAAARTAVPLAALQSEADRVVCPRAPGEWCRAVRAAGGVAAHRVLPAAAHEVFREPNWADHAAALHNWLGARVPAAGATDRPLRRAA